MNSKFEVAYISIAILFSIIPFILSHHFKKKMVASLHLLIVLIALVNNKLSVNVSDVYFIAYIVPALALFLYLYQMIRERLKT